MQNVQLDTNIFTLQESGTITCIPYKAQKTLNCKQRWRMKRLADILKTEFAMSFKSVTSACLDGNLLVNNQPCEPDVVIRNGDVIAHTWTAVEPPVQIKGPMPYYVSPATQVLAVYKPGGLPTVAQGKFFRTNLVSILRATHEYIHPVNRLDKCVSGIVLLKTLPNLSVHVLKKVYFALVVEIRGVFPDRFVCTAKLATCKHVANQVLKTVIDDQNGKESETIFKKLGQKGNKILVECQPVTGRTHQIRAHLSHMGFPIVGDHTYAKTDTEDDSQPNSICLFSVEYTYTVDDGPVQTVCIDPQYYPSWANS